MRNTASTGWKSVADTHCLVCVDVQRRFLIAKGLVASQGVVTKRNQIVGEDIILNNFNRRYTARSLTYVLAYVIARKPVMDLLNSGQFPAIAVRHQRLSLSLACGHRHKNNINSLNFVRLLARRRSCAIALA